jgi:hypothetical protein
VTQVLIIHCIQFAHQSWPVSLQAKENATPAAHQTLIRRISDQEAGKRRTDLAATAQVVDGNLYRDRERIARQHS